MVNQLILDLFPILEEIYVLSHYVVSEVLELCLLLSHQGIEFSRLLLQLPLE